MPVLILARLALQRAERGNGLGGDLLRTHSIRAVAGARHYGARAVMVDALDASAASFYRHHGLMPFHGQRLYRRIWELEPALQA